jgi:hypothetical protein
LGGCSVGISDGLTYEVHIEMASGAVTYIPSLIKIRSGIRIIITVWPQKFERLYILIMRAIYDVNDGDYLKA